MTRRFPRPFLLLLAAAALAAGCSDRPEPVYPVKGQVLLEGQPLADASVVFHRQDGKGRNLVARTDRSGRFELTTHQPGDGAAAGVYLATVELRALVQEGDEPMRSGANLLPPRYAQGQTSGLRCDVQAGVNELPAWELKRQ